MTVRTFSQLTEAERSHIATLDCPIAATAEILNVSRKAVERCRANCRQPLRRTLADLLAGRPAKRSAGYQKTFDAQDALSRVLRNWKRHEA